MRVHICPQPLHGTVCVPPSKSMAHRLLMAAALSAGTSHIDNITLSSDIRATMDGLRALGADITVDGATATVRGLQQFATVTEPVFCNESGSTLRFLIPLFSLTGAPVTFTGAGRLLQRPQQVYADICSEKGVLFTQSESGIRIHGTLPAGEYTVPGNVSSQFISGLLFALPLVSGNSTIHILPPVESRSYIDLTLAALAQFGVEVLWENDNTICIKGGQKYHSCTCQVEGDYSQAAFWLVAGCALGDICVQGLLPNTQQGDAVITDILARCGAHLARQDNAIVCEKSTLHGCAVDLANCPDLGPILMVLALLCEGDSVLRNAGRLRIKESDRIAAMQTEMLKMGGKILADESTVAITGCTLHGSDVLDSHNDHRIAMALAVAAVSAKVEVTIAGAEAVNKSYPSFWQDLQMLGAEVTMYDE